MVELGEWSELTAGSVGRVSGGGRLVKGPVDSASAGSLGSQGTGGRAAGGRRDTVSGTTLLEEDMCPVSL